jgi:hypothetical protein
MNRYRESDSLIVSRKPPNKTGDNKPVAEEVEKRRLAKGNSVERNKGRALNRETLPSEPTRIRQSMFTNNFARHYPRQEPSALAVHAGICAGGAG